jgi:CelD/BcsL family acetyltransferase involved in cellulose biosynthesis
VPGISAPDAVAVRRIDLAELAGRAQEWDAVVEAGPRPSPFMLAAWIESWCSAFSANPASHALTVAERDGALRAVLPLRIARRGLLRTLELVGGDEAAPSDLALHPGEPAATAGAVIRAVRSWGGFDNACLAGLDASGTLCSHAEGLTLVPRLDGPVITVAMPTWSEHVESMLPRDTRKSHRRRLRRLEQTGKLRVEVRGDAAALEAAFAIHDRRWARGRRDGSTFAAGRGREHHRRAFATLACRGRARIALVTLDAEPIAFQYLLEAGASAVCFRTGYDPAHAANSPGTIALHAALEDAVARGVRQIELLGSAEPYKRTIATGARPMAWGIGWARTPHGHAAALAERTRIEARRRLRTHRSRIPLMV